MKDFHIWLHIVAITLVLVFGLYVSIASIFNEDTSRFGQFICVFVFAASLYLIIQRDTYLPFLGNTAMPTSFFKTAVSPEGANVEAVIDVNAPNNTKVVYWGAMPADKSKVMPNPTSAYKDYTNAGIATVVDGKAKIRFFCPMKYEVPWGKVLERHIHYRVITKDGVIGPVKTSYVKC